MDQTIRVIQIGCGPIGNHISRLAMQKPGISVVGAVDVSPSLAGKDLGDVTEINKSTGIRISGDAKHIVETAKPDVAIQSTGSNLRQISDQLNELISYGVNVVSTCEELAFPVGENAVLADSIDARAKEFKVSVLGTGINPGFLMDAWPIFMTGVCQRVDFIKVTRIQDAAERRLPFQKKIGAGCSYQEFQKRVGSKTIRHVGLKESMSMIASGLGWKLDKMIETIEPVLADKTYASSHITVKAGYAAGVKQVGIGFMGDTARIVLEFQASIGASNPYDAVSIQGVPNLTARIDGGTHGDIGTAAMVVNAIPRIIAAPAGFLTMKDLPPVMCL